MSLSLISKCNLTSSPRQGKTIGTPARHRDRGQRNELRVALAPCFAKDLTVSPAAFFSLKRFTTLAVASASGCACHESARPARGGWRHSARGLPSARLALPATIQPAASPFFQEVSFDLLPRQDAGRIFTILRFPVIKLRTLFCAESRGLGFQTFPKRIQQLEFFRCREPFQVLRQNGSCATFTLNEQMQSVMGV